MATSSTSIISAFPQLKKNRLALPTLSLLLLLLLFCFFLFTRTALESKLSLYTDLVSQTVPVLHSSGRSIDIHENFDEIRQPISSESKEDENVYGNTTISSTPSESQVKEEITEPISPGSDLGQKNTVPVLPSDSEFQDDFNEKNSEPTSSNDESIVPISSKSDLDEGKQTILAVKNSSEKPVSAEAENEGIIDNGLAEILRNCHIYKGTWVRYEEYPLYEPGSCPYVDEAFDCQGNGRPDSGYLKWRWKPDGCDLPRFNAKDFLWRLRGKRLMLVGDSMNRNQFESLLCLLREALPDKSKMYEVHGYRITKGRGYYIFKFEDYNCTVEFVRSHFLVREGIRVNAQGNSNPTLSIDRIDKTAARWKRADILVFNTGHWWTHGKTSRGKNYYKEGDYIYPRFDAVEAYRRAIKTWANWIKQNIKHEKLVFYRGYSSAHFRGGDWDSGGTCNGETEPVVRGAILDSYPLKMTIVEEAIKETQVPVVLLNVTRLTNYRKDGHPSIYGKNTTVGRKVSTRKQDCSHWCLPGVPDAWNELIYTTLVARQAY